LGLFTNAIIGMGCLLAAQASPPRAPADPPGTGAPVSARAVRPEEDPSAFWFIILESPKDIAEFWQRLERPDLMVIKGDRMGTVGVRTTGGADRGESPPYLVESVGVAGRVLGDHANLKVALGVTLKGAGPSWVPVRLDGQWLIGAREGARELSLRTVAGRQWQVSLAGSGEHRIEVELRVAVIASLAREAFSLAIPEAMSTVVQLEFSQRSSDVMIGANEEFGQQDLGEGKGSRLAAHLSPRSKLDVSWTGADSGAKKPLLTAQGEIAIDIDLQQVRTRSSWAIQCVRGTSRSLEVKIDEGEEVTELQLDDQAAEDRIERVRGTGKLTIRLADSLRAGGEKRLVMKTRRSISSAGARRISFTGFGLWDAREQSGYIGITQTANLWVSATTSQGLRRIDPSHLPPYLRARPSTSLAFEFLDQPFLLDLGVEPSPPLVRGEAKTFFQIDLDQARSETTVDLQWVGGQVFEVELGVADGLEVVSAGPAEVIESSHLTNEAAGQGHDDSTPQSHRLRLRLTPLARDRNRVTFKLEGLQRIPAEGSMKLGLFTLGKTPVTASYALAAERGRLLELEDESGRLRRSDDLKDPHQIWPVGWPRPLSEKSMGSAALMLVGDGDSAYLPIRITRQARRLSRDTVLTAQVTARSVDLLERTTFTVRQGELRSVEISVPAAIADRWELLEREEVGREELGREPDGTRRYRLSFDRAILDKAILRFRYRLPVPPGPDAAAAREVVIPLISFKEGDTGPAKVALSLAPEVVLDAIGPGWVRSSDDYRAESPGEGPSVQFIEGEPQRPGPLFFTFKARTLKPVPVPSLVVPRLLIKTTRTADELMTSTARYWVESHGPDFLFALPEGTAWVGARVDGRVADQVDYDPGRSEYRMRFPSEVGSRPALVELEYQDAARNSRSTWRAPQLLEGGVVLQSLWEVRLPWSLDLVGIPHGWADENQWYWTGYLWKRRSWKNGTSLNEWILGPGASPSAIGDLDGPNTDDSDHYLFSRSGQPASMGVWIVPRSWLVGTCSGATLVIGFLAIFSKLRFRTIWVGIAGLSLLAAVILQPSVTFLAIQSAVIGGGLTLVGLFIEQVVERSKWLRRVPSGGSVSAARPGTDSSLTRPVGVGSDDSTAIRVRVPSTLDHVATAPANHLSEEGARSSTVERA
jgi:hypothetical protein